MKNVLLVTSSPRGELSHSSYIATKFAKALNGNLVERSLVEKPLPHIDPAFIHATRGGADRSTAAEAVDLSDKLISEVKAADIVVVAAGMINFGVPSVLKTWIDYLARPRETFSYGEDGPEGLIKGKKLVLVLSYGGAYSSGPAQAMDFVEPYLKAALGFLGMTDVEVIKVEGIAFGVEAALERAEGQSQQVLERLGASEASATGTTR